MLIAHPSPDLYGSDLQMLETVQGLLSGQFDVTVAMPEFGPLTSRVEESGASLVQTPFPVLRKSALSPAGLLSSALAHLKALRTLSAYAGVSKPDVIVVNTVTIPIWLLVGRLLRVPTICHVHEAEEEGRRVVLLSLLAPLHLADRVVTNSDAASRALHSVYPGLAPRTFRIYNGVEVRERSGSAVRPDTNCVDLLFVGRISPRKGPDVLIRAAAGLVRQGIPVRLRIVGSVFQGYEWYHEELLALTERLEMSERVEFCGYRTDPFNAASAQTILVVPSRSEPFGNVAVEAQMLGLPVIASDVQGLSEIVKHGVTGLLFDVGSHESLVDRVQWILDHPAERTTMIADARNIAFEKFGVDRYHAEFAQTVRMALR
ncbi:glycosyltransferase family 4 protein [Gordonia sp. p3-SID1431]|uniref:glycosyltransferase family 4 protein n=1 Tax=Gordonia sp. p3-SID1431 TaxID=2916159 RepID=UPI0021A6265F|nr:glycosyltransferase family 4 protein [Gordonia sp. p3-SID1431]MCT1353178.1 glycosyltransferase family 4 protein [Gordonia sp. p3-SID1431]